MTRHGTQTKGGYAPLKSRRPLALSNQYSSIVKKRGSARLVGGTDFNDFVQRNFPPRKRARDNPFRFDPHAKRGRLFGKKSVHKRGLKPTVSSQRKFARLERETLRQLALSSKSPLGKAALAALTLRDLTAGYETFSPPSEGLTYNIPFVSNSLVGYAGGFTSPGFFRSGARTYTWYGMNAFRTAENLLPPTITSRPRWVRDVEPNSQFIGVYPVPLSIPAQAPGPILPWPLGSVLTTPKPETD